ncbi:STM3941 family protein [Ornithinibacillus xuwenensis]|uniref:STM3941 family protein n=1 Tax=Ornithinibacillus xuwenensis TaxID=3144668 RepID=A0ABU9XGT3_9BACI
MGDIVIYPKRGKLIVYSVLSLMFVTLGIFLFVVGFTEAGSDGMKFIIIGMITFVFFGLCMMYLIKVLFNRKPALIITDEGILDDSTYIGAGLIKWEEIANIDFVHFSRQTYLGIYTHDPELIINRSTKYKRMLNRLNKGLLDSQVNIPIKILDCSIEDLVARINERWQKAIERESNSV